VVGSVGRGECVGVVGVVGVGGLGLAEAGLGLVYLRVLAPAKTTLHPLWNFFWTFSACERSLTYLACL
jgi:hypothetical protein